MNQFLCRRDGTVMRLDRADGDYVCVNGHRVQAYCPAHRVLMKVRSNGKLRCPECKRIARRRRRLLEVITESRRAA